MSESILSKTQLNINLEMPQTVIINRLTASLKELVIGLSETMTEVPELLIVHRKRDLVSLVSGKQVGKELIYPWQEAVQSWGDLGRFTADVYLRLNQNVWRIQADEELKNEQFQPVKNVDDAKDTRVVLLEWQSQKHPVLILQAGNLYQMAAARFKTKVTLQAFKLKKDEFTFQVQVKGPYVKAMDFLEFRMIQRTTIERREISYPIDSHNISGNSVVLTGTIDNHGEWVPFNWDLYIVFKHTEWPGRGLLEIKKMSPKLIPVIDRDQFKKALYLPDSHIMYPYMTVAGNLAFTYRPLEAYETPKVLRTERWAVRFAKLASPWLSKKNIWIGYEKNAFGAHDNGYHFFKYVYDSGKYDEMYYVIRPESPEADNLSRMSDKTLRFMSWKYFVYLYSAKLLISSDSKFHVYNMQRRDSKIAKALMRKKNVFLQHGVNGMKKVPVFHKSQGWLDFIIAPSQFEKDNITVPEWGYPAEDVAVTGYARWDSYEDKTADIPFRQIFVMPTWRNWMEGMSREKFVETPFYKEYQAFLSSEHLKKLLKESNARIAFFLHPYFKDYVDLFDIDESVIDRYGYLEVDMGEEIQKSSLMISDYSSVLWDMYYLKRPTIFYQFDRESYLQDEGAYLDYDKDSFGDVTFTAEETIQAIQKYVEQDFREDKRYELLRPKYFNYVDHENSARIFQAIAANAERLMMKKDSILKQRIKRKLKKVIKKVIKK